MILRHGVTSCRHQHIATPTTRHNNAAMLLYAAVLMLSDADICFHADMPLSLIYTPLLFCYAI